MTGVKYTSNSYSSTLFSFFANNSCEVWASAPASSYQLLLGPPLGVWSHGSLLTCPWYSRRTQCYPTIPAGGQQRPQGLHSVPSHLPPQHPCRTMSDLTNPDRSASHDPGRLPADMFSHKVAFMVSIPLQTRGQQLLFIHLSVAGILTGPLPISQQTSWETYEMLAFSSFCRWGSWVVLSHESFSLRVIKCWSQGWNPSLSWTPSKLFPLQHPHLWVSVISHFNVMHLAGAASSKLTDPGIFTQGSVLSPHQWLRFLALPVCLSALPALKGSPSPLLSGTPSCLFESL